MDIFDEIEGLQPVDPAVLEPFLRAMREEVIPEIVRTMEERERLWKEYVSHER